MSFLDVVLVICVYVPAAVWCIALFISYVTCGVCKSRARLDGKTVILTGCTSGIGIATALDLARRGARLIMACRNLEKANEVRKYIEESTDNKNVVVMRLDVSDLSSVRSFAEEVNRNESRLDVLIHNAGIVNGGHKTTDDNICKVWATNHFGPFLLTHLLIDLLKKTGRSRIIYVSSIMHYLGKINLKNPNPNPVKEKRIGAFYNSSKFANVLITRELSRRLKGSGVTVNCLHPGAINTPIFQQAPLWFRVMMYISSPMLKTVEQGAQTTIHLAVSQHLHDVTGKFFCDCSMWLGASKRTGDKVLAKEYWRLSEEIVKLKPTDPHILAVD